MRGLYAFGPMIGYFFVFLIVLLVLLVLVVMPSTIIYYVLQIPATATECPKSNSLPEAVDADLKTEPRSREDVEINSSSIDDEDFEGW
jgi:ABC-type Na+ efflux pump permease subunit